MTTRMIEGHKDGVACFGYHTTFECDDGSDGQIAQPLSFEREMNCALKMLLVFIHLH